MLSMPFADPIFARSARTRVAGLLALVATAVTPALAGADTGAQVPQSYPGNVAIAPEAPPTEGDPADAYADTDPSALTDFRQPLDPHGTWVQDPTYGTVWVPNSAEVGDDFAPYQTAGHWATADSGDWMWESDYAWGAIPFHYGRWVWANSYWGWIPGRTYAPAWVTWRVGDGGYLGWAPLPPTWYWGNGYAVGLGRVPYAAYCFVPTNRAFYSNVSNYVVRDRGAVQQAAASTRPYHPATPSVGSPGNPAGSHAPQHAGRGMSPSLADARIPASAAPRSAASADPRAMAYATPRSSAGIRGTQASMQGHTLSNGGNAWHNSYERSPSSSPNAGRESSFHESAGRSGSSFRGSPSFEVTRPGGGYAAPGYHGGAPGYHGAPASTSHAPSHSSSAPARSTGRSSGGFRGGGGHHR